jgi:hypothetical protein
MKTAVEHLFTGTTQSISSYDSTKTLLGSLFRQYTGLNAKDKYVAPVKSAISNTIEVSGAIYQTPHVYKWSENIYWVFVSVTGTAPTRTLGLFEYNALQGTIVWKGFITLSGTSIAGNKIVRSLRAFVYKHSTGTVSTSGLSSTITGSSTLFTDQRIAVGARIGFGSTDPTQITSWYEILTISNNTALTINGSVDLSSSTSYVIEEIRLLVGCTNVTVQNGGPHLIKGLNYSTFQLGGVTIPEGNLVDNIRASYLLKDNRNGTVTMTIATPAVFSKVGHGFISGDAIRFTTTGALPTGLAINTTYYVISAGLTADEFRVAATINGVAINTSGTQSGTHTVFSIAMGTIMGIADDTFTSNTQHDVYVLNALDASSVKIHRLNIRAALTVDSTGVSSNAWSYQTDRTVVTGTILQLNNGKIFTVSHSSASGVKSLWFNTATRIYRCNLSSVTSGSSSWLSDFMLEIPPATTATYSITNAFNQVDYIPESDRIIIPTAAARFGLYITRYDPTNTNAFDTITGINLLRLNTSATPDAVSDTFFQTSTTNSIWVEDSILFTINLTSVNGTHMLSAVPLGVEAEYDIGTQEVITPELSTPNARKLYRAYVANEQYRGNYGLGMPCNGLKIYFRTSGINDNTGAWILLDSSGDLTPYPSSSSIQFLIKFKMIDTLCTPTVVHSVSCIYEDGSQDSHYQPSLNKSSSVSKIFAWQQVSAWGTAIPNLKLTLYDASNGTQIFTDTVSASDYGTWQYSLDGSTWYAWNSSSDVVNSYIRYTATGFGYSGVTVRALLTQEA